MLGPPRNSKLLFEAHLLRLAYPNMAAVWNSTPEAVRDTLDRLVRDNPEVANDVVSVGIPILLVSGEVLRGVNVIVPPDAKAEAVTPEKLETWVRDGWVDLRLANCEMGRPPPEDPRRDRRPPPGARRQLQPLPPQPPLLAQGGRDPAGQGGGMDSGDGGGGIAD